MSSSASYDAIVLGAGGVGSAAMYHLARRGLKVLGLDRFAPPHDRGSSHGQTRIIRQAYFEHPDYVPLLLESYRLWADLERQAGRNLLINTGLVEIGPENGFVVPGVLEAARLHELPVEKLTPAATHARWPALHCPDDMVAVFEPRAGVLRVEQCVRAHLEAAQEAGAELRIGVEASGWSFHGDSATVDTTAGRFSAARLIVTAGAWAERLLADLELQLVVRRKTLMWYPENDPAMRADSGFPAFLFETPKGVFYGMPSVDGAGVKVAEHSGGEPVDDPLCVERSLREEDRLPVEAFVRTHLPTLEPACREHAVCLYTMSPDEHFIVDRHPNYPQVALAAGLSGHGFKFVPALGAALADLAIHGATRLPIEFLSLKRFGSSL